MRRISAYLDTGALIAALDRSDTFHELFVRLFADPPPLYTTALVVAEGQAWFLRRYDSLKALQFMAFIDELPRLLVTEVGAAEIAAATVYLRKFRDRKLTLADAVGLHLIRTQKLKLVWSTDRHLALTGAELVIR